MQYVMVTDRPGHWDKIKGNKTSYEPAKLSKPITKDKLVENTETIFIKINRKSGLPEKAWHGKVNDFQFIDEKLFFTVTTLKEIKIPDRYECLIVGWHVLESNFIDIWQ